MSAADQRKPIVVLVRPQLGENIGKAARAMLNFGLTEMRLVEPRDGWPNPSAGPAAAGPDRGAPICIYGATILAGPHGRPGSRPGTRPERVGLGTPSPVQAGISGPGHAQPAKAGICRAGYAHSRTGRSLRGWARPAPGRPDPAGLEHDHSREKRGPEPVIDNQSTSKP